MFSLKDKVALITGASQGIGRATALALAESGAKVAVAARNAEKLAVLVSEIEAAGGEALAVTMDVADAAQVKAGFQQTVARFGKLDILVNNAAIAVQGKTVDDPELDTVNLDRQWQINVMGAVATTRAAAPVLPDGGRIIFIGSLLGSRIPFTGVADYAATKAAVAGYAKGVARDLGSRNITVNIVQPGIMPTDMAAEVRDKLPDAIMDLHPIRRIATLEEVSAVVAFLAGPSGGYITGGVVDVAGGLQV